MPASQYPPDLGRDLQSIRRRLELLEKALGLSATTIVNDLSGVTRVGVGQLDNIFPSAGYAADTYGIRVQDGSGAAILDSVGLQQVATAVPLSGVGGPDSGPYTVSSSEVYLSRYSASFALYRQTTVLFAVSLNGLVSGTAGDNQVKVSMEMVGGNGASTGQTVSTLHQTGAYIPVSGALVAMLAAGTCTCRIGIFSLVAPGGVSFSVDSGTFQVIRMGG